MNKELIKPFCLCSLVPFFYNQNTTDFTSHLVLLLLKFEPWAIFLPRGLVSSSFAFTFSELFRWHFLRPFLFTKWACFRTVFLENPNWNRLIFRTKATFVMKHIWSRMETGLRNLPIIPCARWSMEAMKKTIEGFILSCSEWPFFNLLLWKCSKRLHPY